MNKPLRLSKTSVLIGDVCLGGGGVKGRKNTILNTVCLCVIHKDLDATYETVSVNSQRTSTTPSQVREGHIAVLSLSLEVTKGGQADRA